MAELSVTEHFKQQYPDPETCDARLRDFMDVLAWVLPATPTERLLMAYAVRNGFMSADGSLYYDADLSAGSNLPHFCCTDIETLRRTVADLERRNILSTDTVFTLFRRADYVSLRFDPDAMRAARLAADEAGQ